jgi:hypothetical protein
MYIFEAAATCKDIARIPETGNPIVLTLAGYRYTVKARGFKFTSQLRNLSAFVKLKLRVSVQEPSVYLALQEYATTGSASPTSTQPNPANPKGSRSYQLTWYIMLGSVTKISLKSNKPRNLPNLWNIKVGRLLSG